MKVTETTPVKTITMKTTDKKTGQSGAFAWWKAKSKGDLQQMVLSTAKYLKEAQNFRQRNAAIFARLYGNQSLFSFVGSSLNKTDQTNNMNSDRPTFNIVQSCTDTLVSRISQARPQPVFLTDNSNYKERNL